MAGLAMICKLHGKVRVTQNGKTVTWVWDWVDDKPVLESQMTKERWAESEKIKWEQLKKGRNE